jgi:5-methylcytosine-specific restriction endonuclease McrA
MPRVASAALLAKPHGKCGLVDRYPNGNCRPCQQNFKKAHRTYVREYEREWRRLHPDAVARQGARSCARRVARYATDPEYRRRIAGQNATRNRADREERIVALIVRQLGECGLCRGPIVGVERIPGARDTLVVDHIIPKARGGTNDLGNLRVVHVACNQAKRAAMDAEILTMRVDKPYRCADCGSTRLEFAV